MRSIYQSLLKPRWLLMLSFLLLYMLFPWRFGEGAEEIPTIEALTGGKLKAGDLITKENVDLVKDLLAPSTYECVKRGNVLMLAPTTPLDLTVPAYFLEATEKNAGKAVVGENKVVYTKDRGRWLGGFPFPDPKTGTEAMLNNRFGGLSYGSDDFNFYVWMQFVNKKGELYKYNDSWYRKMYVQPRLKIPPLGTISGQEKELYRGMIFFLEPYDIRGLSQLVIRYYDDKANPDDGFLYLPALKRTRRISSTNWQDNMAGSDATWGDADGFAEPYAGWDFKLVEKRFMILPGDSNPLPKKKPDGTWDPGIQYDVGVKFEKLQWEVRPTYIVECLPQEKHVYGKRVMYLDGLHFKTKIMNNYDRQMRLWREWIVGCSHFKGEDGYYYGVTHFPHWYDFQIDHMTRLTTLVPKFNTGSNIEEYTLKKMLEMGR